MRSLVQQVDGLVRQEPVGNIPLCQNGAQAQHCRRDVHSVVCLVVLGDAIEHLDGFFHIRFIDGDRLETAFQCGILFDVLAVLLECGRTDHLHLAAGEGGLQDVSSVHGALRVACANQIVHFVNEEDDVSLLLHLGEQSLDTALELTTELCAGNQRG
mgnify:CR=1 FL=1